MKLMKLLSVPSTQRLSLNKNLEERTNIQSKYLTKYITNQYNANFTIHFKVIMTKETDKKPILIFISLKFKIEPNLCLCLKINHRLTLF